MSNKNAPKFNFILASRLQLCISISTTGTYFLHSSLHKQKKKIFHNKNVHIGTNSFILPSHDAGQPILFYEETLTGSVDFMPLIYIICTKRKKKKPFTSNDLEIKDLFQIDMQDKMV